MNFLDRARRTSLTTLLFSMGKVIRRKKTGTGLGLAIAKQIAARHGITVEVLSKTGRETTFFFHYIT